MRSHLGFMVSVVVICVPLLFASVKSADSGKDASVQKVVYTHMITFHYPNHLHQTVSTGSIPNGGVITCKAYVNPASPCEGKGLGYLSPNTYLITPATDLWIPSTCDGIKCVTTDWKTWGYGTTVKASGKIYNWKYGIIYACTSDNTWCANPIDRWTSITYSPVVKIIDAPGFVPLVIYVEYVYETKEKDWETLNVNQDLLLGYG